MGPYDEHWTALLEAIAAGGQVQALGPDDSWVPATPEQLRGAPASWGGLKVLGGHERFGEGTGLDPAAPLMRGDVSVEAWSADLGSIAAALEAQSPDAESPDPESPDGGDDRPQSLPEAGGTTSSSVTDSPGVFDSSGSGTTGQDMVANDMFDTGGHQTPGMDRRQ